MILASDIVKLIREIEDQNSRGYLDALEEILSDVSRHWQPYTLARLAIRVAKRRWNKYDIACATTQAMIDELQTRED